MSRCVTQAGYEVEAGENLKGEKLDVSDWTAAVGDDGDERSDGEGSDAVGNLRDLARGSV